MVLRLSELGMGIVRLLLIMMYFYLSVYSYSILWTILPIIQVICKILT